MVRCANATVSVAGPVLPEEWENPFFVGLNRQDCQVVARLDILMAMSRHQSQRHLEVYPPLGRAGPKGTPGPAGASWSSLEASEPKLEEHIYGPSTKPLWAGLAMAATSAAWVRDIPFLEEVWL